MSNRKGFIFFVSMIVILTFSIAFGVIMSAVTSFAHSTDIIEAVKKLDIKESLLNSQKYLVTDYSISRVAPNTGIENIVDQFNKEIKIQQKDSDNEIRDGLIKTGMRISDDECGYDVSVLGDINEDGLSDHVDLTQLIRSSINTDKLEFDNAQKLSSDLNVDGTTDVSDVDASIKYILYGELNIPEFDPVNEPEIEIVEGTYNDIIESYEDTVKIRISNQDEKAIKTKYKVDGIITSNQENNDTSNEITTLINYTEIQNGETIDISQYGVYKISAYSYGELGNRSEIPYKIVIIKSPNNKYKVKTLTENVDGTYEEKVEEKEGRIGTTVTVQEESIEGFEVNQDKSRLSGEILEDDELELVVTYDRKNYDLTLNSGEFISMVQQGDESDKTINKKVKYGASVDINAYMEEKAGYSTTFLEWVSSNTQLIPNKDSKETTITMPAGDVELTATATRTARSDVSYTIGYYYQENGQYPDKPNSSEIKNNGVTGEEVEVKDEEKIAPNGYALDETKSQYLKGIVAGDGTLELKVYYKQQFKVEYLPGLHGTFDGQVTEGLDYGAEMPQFEGETSHHDGYEFAGWDKDIDNTVTQNVQYTATWNEVEYKITYDLQQGNFVAEEEQDVKYTYTISTESFTLHTPVRNGYRFTGWSGTDIDDKEESVEVQKGSIGDRSYTANWEAMTNISYTVEYYGEKLEEGYELLEKTTLTNGTTDTVVEIDTTKEFVGYELDRTQNQDWSGVVTADGKLVLKAYYNRKLYKLTLYTERENNVGKLILRPNGTEETGEVIEKTLGDEESISIEKSIKYGASVEIDAEESQKPGYTTIFSQWKSNNEALFENQSSKSYTLQMPAGDLQLTALATRTANSVGYTVEYYYMGDDGQYPTSPSTTDSTRTEYVGEKVAITEQDKIPQLEGYTEGYAYDEDAENVTEATVEVDDNGDGTTKLKVHFKKTKHTLTVIAGENIANVNLNGEESEENGTLSKEFSFGEQIQIDATPSTEPGYDITFTKWTSDNQQAISDGTTKNLTFSMPSTDVTLTATANKTAKEVTYNKEFYYQKDGVYPDEPEDTLPYQAKVGETVSITPSDKEPIKEHYAYDEEAEGKIESDTVRVNEDEVCLTVLKIYYKQQFTVTYKPGEHGAFEERVYDGIDYNDDIPEYDGTFEGSDGYIFDGWTPEKTDLDKVTEDLIFTASWTKMSVPTITHEPETWTNEKVEVTIEKPEGYEDYSIEYSIDDENNWTTYNEPFEQQENCTVHARLFLGENKGDTANHEINNIDKEAPKFVEVTPSLKSSDEAIINVKATDDLSGIVEYGIEMEKYAGETKYTCESTKQKDDISFSEIYENGTYQIYLKDQAGNISTHDIEITGIEPYNVAVIVSAPEGYTDLIDTEYTSLELALSASKEAAKAGNVEIKIIHNIHNEMNTILPESDYTIDLNNYYIQSMQEGNTLTVQGNLQVVDRNKVGAGAIYSPFGVGIYIELNGELTLGEDDNKTPSVLSPVVEGTIYGIQKQKDDNAQKVVDEETGKEYSPEGKFNFYDGKIIGTDASINMQRVNSTPQLYDPTTRRNEETGKQETILAITSGVEALIENKRYTSIEEAIEDANNRIGDSTQQIEILVVSDLIKENSIEVDETKNIKIDLNGHTITTSAEDYVFKNYGKLEVYDSVTEYNENNLYSYSIDATQAKDVIPAPKSGTTVSNLESLNFDFDIEDDKLNYTLTIDGSNLKRGCTVKLDDEEIFDLANSSSATQAVIELGVLEVGTHNISLASTGSSKPSVSKFTINNTYSPGSIKSTTASTILNSISPEAYAEVEYEDISMDARDNGDYIFKTRAEGGLISDNAGKKGTALSYVELDLTNKEGLYNVVVNASISAAKGHYGFITVTNDVEKPAYNDSNGRKVYIEGDIDYEDYEFCLVGGKKYYINFGYYKPSTTSTGQDCFVIKSMKYGKIDKAGDLTLNSGVYSNSISGNSLAVIENNSIVHINGATLKADVEYTSAVRNGTADEAAYLEVNKGTISTARGSSIQNYGSSLVTVNNGSISESGSNYANVYNYNRALVDILGGTFEGYYAVRNENVGKIVIKAGSLYGSYNSICNNSTSLYGATIEGGDFKTSANNTSIYNSSTGNIKIENACIKVARTGVLNGNSGNVEIDNIQMTDVDEKENPTVSVGIQNNGAGLITVNNSNIFIKERAIYNSNKGNIVINGGQIKNNSTDYATIENTGNNNAKISILGGTVEGKGGAISNSGTSSTIVIGDESSQVDTTTPTIKGSTYAIRNYYGNMEFYDGELIGEKNGVIVGILNDIADEHELVRSTDTDNLQKVTLGIPVQYVAQIDTSGTSNSLNLDGMDQSYYQVEGGVYKFITLNSAVQACNTNTEHTIELIDDPWVYRTINIEENDNITIKFNDHTIYELTESNLVNKGTLKLENDSPNDINSISSTGGLLFDNNQNATMEVINLKLVYESGQGSSSNYKNLINNQGRLDIKDCKYDALVKGTSTSSYAYPIYNGANGIVNIDNKNVEDPMQTEFATFMINLADDVDTETENDSTYAVTINNTKIQGKSLNVAINNNGNGTININSSEFTNDSTYSSFNFNNNSAGKILLNESKVKNNVINTKDGHVEINNTVISDLNNRSTGSALIKGDDSTLTKINNENKEGHVTMEGGTVSQGTVAIANKGILDITGGKVERKNNDSGYAIENTNSAVATISGDTQIISNAGGIKNSATLVIEGGKVIATGSKVGGIENTKSLTVGVKDRNVKYIPIISGGLFGVSNKETFNFYDGIIEGNVTQSIQGAIPTETEIGTSTVIFKSNYSGGSEYIFKQGTEDEYKVSSGREISVLEQAEVAYLESSKKNYNSIQSALADANQTDTIKVIHDVSINGSADSITIEDGDNITLDLNGYNVVVARDDMVVNNGTLTITDNNDKGLTSSFVSGANTILQNNGTCTINRVKFELTLGGDSKSYYNLIENNSDLTINDSEMGTTGSYSNIISSESGTITITNGTFHADNTYSKVIDNNGSTITIKSGTYKASKSGSIGVCNNSGSVVIEDGTVEGVKYSVDNEGTGTIDIKNGTYTGQVYNNLGGTLNIHNGTVNGQVYNNNTNSTTNISDGTFTDRIYNNGGTMTITGGTISGKGNAITNDNGGNMTIDGTGRTEENPIVIDAINNNSATGILNTGSSKVATLNVKGHVHINATTDNGSNQIGIENNNHNVAIIGDPNSTSDNINDDVKINVADYGLYSYQDTADSTTEFYGGVITAKEAIRGYIAHIVEGTNIVTTINDDDYEVCKLGKYAEAASVGETKYSTLKEAFDDSSTKKTIKLLDDITVMKEEILSIDENEEITLDLNGHSIKLVYSGEAFSNNGTFKITDNSTQKEGKIYGYATVAIKNKGELEVINGTIKINQRKNEKIIHNVENGTIKISGGTIYNYARTVSSSYYNIYSENSNQIDVLGGTIETDGRYQNLAGSISQSTMYGIYCTSPNTTVNVIDGYFKHSGDSIIDRAIYISNSADNCTVNMSGNASCDDAYTVYAESPVTIDLKDNINLNNSSYSIYVSYNKNEDSTINIKGGTLKQINGNVRGGKCTIEMTGGEITGSTGIDVSNNFDVNIHDGAKINVTGNAIYEARNVHIDGGTIIGKVARTTTLLEMTGGTITGSNLGIEVYGSSSVVNVKGGEVTATKGPGILITSGTLNLGENTEDYPNTTTPAITGSTYGVKNDNGTFNFYDGVLTGDSNAISGTVTSTPESFSVIYSSDEKVAILGIKATFDQVAKVNDVYYDDLPDAIEAAALTNGTITLYKNISIQQTTEIPADKTITIDLAGFSLYGYVQSGEMITNNGNLIIIDSSTDDLTGSSICNYQGIAIANKGTLTIGRDGDSVNTITPIIKGLETAISNSGTIKFFDGKIGRLKDNGTIIDGASNNITVPQGYRKEEQDNCYILVNN